MIKKYWIDISKVPIKYLNRNYFLDIDVQNELGLLLEVNTNGDNIRNQK